MNKLQRIMQTKLDYSKNNKRGTIVNISLVKTNAEWLKNHRQIDNGKRFEKI